MLNPTNQKEYKVVPYQGGAALVIEGDDKPLYTSGDVDKVLDLYLDTCTGTNYTDEYKGCNCHACVTSGRW